MNDKFFDLSLDILCIVQADGTFVRANQGFCEMLGFSEQELKSKKIFDFIHPDDLQVSSEACEEGRENKNIDNFTNRYINRQGKVHHISWRTRFIEEEGRIYASGRDVTNEVNVKEKLQEALNLLNYTGSIAKIGGWSFIVESGETFWTDETYKILDLKKEGGKVPDIDQVLSLFVGSDRSKYEAAVTAALKDGIPYDLELKMKTLKGAEIWVFVSGRPIFENGKVSLLTGVIQDIDEKVKAQEVLKERQQKSVLQSRLASIGELAAGVGHEINNPLAISSGYLHRLKRYKEVSPEITDIINNIEIGHERIKEITEGLRGLSRAETKKSVFCLKQVINEFFLFVQKIYEFENIALEFATTSHDDVNIFANRAEIQQVIMNLVANAKDAVSEANPKKITLSLSRNKSENGHADKVILSVRDNGNGINHAIKDKVFDSFFTTKELGEGTGLGLPLVHRIVKDHDGDIWFESQKGEGTTFFVKLPVVDEPHEKLELPASGDLQLYRQGLSVLVVDDEKGIRMSLKLILEDLGCEVIEAQTAEKAIALISNYEFDVIISDILMPKMTGTELLKTLVDKELKKSSKFIFLTGGFKQQEALQHSSLDYDGLIMKPFREEDLIKAINNSFNS